MCSINTQATKIEFIKFLTNDQETINYNNQVFTKTLSANVVKIEADGELVYQVHQEKKLLIVLKALYMTFLKDEYWGIAKDAGLEEVIADPNTLIRI